MKSINLEFYEAYKQLDLLCKQAMDTNYGVSEYIKQMDDTSCRDLQNVQFWIEDLKQLKRMYRIHTELSQRPGSFEDSLCTQEDIDWLNDFYIRLLNQTDPFSLLVKKEECCCKAGGWKALLGQHKEVLKKVAVGGAIALGVVTTIACIFSDEDN